MQCVFVCATAAASRQKARLTTGSIFTLLKLCEQHTHHHSLRPLSPLPFPPRHHHLPTTTPAHNQQPDLQPPAPLLSLLIANTVALSLLLARLVALVLVLLTARPFSRLLYLTLLFVSAPSTTTTAAAAVLPLTRQRGPQAGGRIQNWRSHDGRCIKSRRNSSTMQTVTHHLRYDALCCRSSIATLVLVARPTPAHADSCS